MSAQPIEPEGTVPTGPDQQAETPHLQPVPDPPTTNDPQPDLDEPTSGQQSSKKSTAGGTRGGARGSATGLFGQARDTFTPPDVWNRPQPSLRERCNYARWSEQYPSTGPLRWAALGWFGISAMATASYYIRAWVMERPTRAAVVTAIVTLAALFGPTRTVMTFALWPAHELIELFTDLD